MGGMSGHFSTQSFLNIKSSKHCWSHVLYDDNGCTGKPTHCNIQQRNVSIIDLGKIVGDEAGMCLTPLTLRPIFLV